MPQYFFHIHHGKRDPDQTGVELPDKQAAWEEATITAGQMLQSLDGRLQPDEEWRMEVADEFQNVLFVLHIKAEIPS